MSGFLSPYRVACLAQQDRGCLWQAVNTTTSQCPGSPTLPCHAPVKPSLGDQETVVYVFSPTLFHLLTVANSGWDLNSSLILTPDDMAEDRDSGGWVHSPSLFFFNSSATPPPSSKGWVCLPPSSSALGLSVLLPGLQGVFEGEVSCISK